MQNETIRCIVQWLKIRAASGKEFPSSPEQMEEFLKNSYLLPKLLRGEQPLSEPPPLSHGNPWYSLIERGLDIAYEVKEGDPYLRRIHGGDILIVNDYP